MRCTLALPAALSVLALLGNAAPAAAQVQPDQAAKIRKAASARICTDRALGPRIDL